MRTIRWAALAGAVLLSMPAWAQQDQGGVRGAIDQLNRTVNPNSSQDTRSQRPDDTRRSGEVGQRRDYRRFSDRDLQDEYENNRRNLNAMANEQREIEEEMRSRGMRR
ncbi:MAG TPA: hypothetical protein VEY95_14775 [Azospirillaceae bacterium]|nr:hypothetical protein [Azospirillaceae bacterium]